MISEPLRHPLSLFDVKDKVAIITGASGAFGRGCAITLARSAASCCWRPAPKASSTRSPPK